MKKLLLIGLSLIFGQYQLVAQSTMIRGSSLPLSFDIRRTQPRLPDRNDYALIIANSKYDDPRYRTLPNCVFDAEELERLLNQKFAFKTDILRRTTYKEFKSKLEEYNSRKWNEDDQLLVYVAGHGGFDSVTREGFLVMRDANRTEQTHCFSLLSLQRILKNLPCKHVLVILDVCYGGTFDEAIALEGDVTRGDLISDPSTIPTGNPHPEYILKKLKPRTRMYLASGGKEPVQEGRAGEHSPFAGILLSKLSETTTGTNKLLTIYELTNTLENKLPTVRMGAFDGNQPSSDFLFIAK